MIGAISIVAGFVSLVVMFGTAGLVGGTLLAAVLVGAASLLK